MALGKHSPRQTELFIQPHRLTSNAGHPFYRKLNSLLSEADFDSFVERECEPHYREGKGRPSVPPGRYFRMLLIGYFEIIDSERGMEWRCQDSLSLRDFLGLGLEDRVPDHSSLSRIRVIGRRRSCDTAERA